jgi:hypothetical protein
MLGGEKSGKAARTPRLSFKFHPECASLPARDINIHAALLVFQGARMHSVLKTASFHGPSRGARGAAGHSWIEERRPFE